MMTSCTILSLREFILYEAKKMSQYRHYRLFIFRRTCRSGAVIFNHYRSPLVISERNIPALIARQDALRGIVRNICEIGVGN